MPAPAAMRGADEIDVDVDIDAKRIVISGVAVALPVEACGCR
ncbi:MAG: hypothetical protein ABIQ60_01165 [Burkholderiaceae bacterium]